MELTTCVRLLLLLCLFGFSFNKKEEDFDTLREWNDYLEQTEDISTPNTSALTLSEAVAVSVRGDVVAVHSAVVLVVCLLNLLHCSSRYYFAGALCCPCCEWSLYWHVQSSTWPTT